MCRLKPSAFDKNMTERPAQLLTATVRPVIFKKQKVH